MNPQTLILVNQILGIAAKNGPQIIDAIKDAFSDGKEKLTQDELDLMFMDIEDRLDKSYEDYINGAE